MLDTKKMEINRNVLKRQKKKLSIERKLERNGLKRRKEREKKEKRKEFIYLFEKDEERNEGM